VDFAARGLPTVILRAPIVRIHRRTDTYDFFGKTGRNRFDAPDKSFGVFYAGRTLEAAFSETFLRDPPRDTVFQTDLDARWRTTVVHKPLVLLQAFGAGLARMGVTAEIGTCPYAISQAWSKATHDHPRNVDGIMWAGRHDNLTRSIALFERAKGKLTSHHQEAFDQKTVARLIRRWGFALG
jgi:hypothetical protein